jgi:hypothetical protein
MSIVPLSRPDAHLKDATGIVLFMFTLRSQQRAAAHNERRGKGVTEWQASAESKLLRAIAHAVAEVKSQ